MSFICPQNHFLSALYYTLKHSLKQVKKRAYSWQEFSRRKNTTLMGMSLWILSPEDSILSKLEWSKGRESQTQFKDALGVIVVQWDSLDFDYLKKWAKELRIQDSLEQLLKQAQELKKLK